MNLEFLEFIRLYLGFSNQWSGPLYAASGGADLGSVLHRKRRRFGGKTDLRSAHRRCGGYGTRSTNWKTLEFQDFLVNLENLDLDFLVQRIINLD